LVGSGPTVLHLQSWPDPGVRGTPHAKGLAQAWMGPARKPPRLPSTNESKLMLGTVLVILLVLMLLGALPRWPHSRDWGYYPSGGVGLVLGILVILLLLGRI